MKLSIKKGKRNLQEIYSTITDAYSNGSLDEMKKMSEEFCRGFLINFVCF